MDNKGPKLFSMETFTLKWVLLAFLISCVLLFREAHSADRPKVKAVNLGGWLVIEGWMKPSLFDGIPNKDMLDGRQVQFKSVTLQKYIAAENGGGDGVSVNRDAASGWETFKLWRVSETEFQFRSFGGQFLTCGSEGALVSARATTPSSRETFSVERNTDNNRVHIKLSNGAYLQATSANEIRADYEGNPGWDDNVATFEMTILPNNRLQGDYQLANGYGQDKAKEVYENHRSSFVTEKDFQFLSSHGINTVRIPVGWWIASDPNPPAPFVGGSLASLDNAFSWAEKNGMKCIIDLHAARGSQNGMDHSASRDGTTGWPDYISESLEVITFLASRYANNPALLGIELLNEPSASTVSLEVLVPYYKKGYEIVRKFSPSAYVIVCQRIGDANPRELFNAGIGSTNLVVDLHYYNLFSPNFNNLTPMENIQFIYDRRRPEIQGLNSANGPLVFIGEWVNEWNVRNAAQMDYQTFGKAQLDVYGEASFGWAYWSFRNVQKHWDLEWNINNDYLQLG